MRLILRQLEAGPPLVCPPVTGVRPELARIAVPAPRLSAYDALVKGAADLKVLRLPTVASQWQPPAEQAVRQRQTPADYLA